ncbi:MAG: hypothetical protein HZB65_03260 [Candidatus Aenigmarchaeota archaeon]|nr:hypothetical protein [Candidatus Aenigmarchaeota archaeon]
MKKTGIVLILFALIGVLLVSGCVGQRSVTMLENDGLRVVDFSAEPTTADAGDVITFTGSVENVGYVDATDVEVSLGGIENNWKTATGSLIADSNEFTKKYSKLFSPNPTYNQPGDLRVASWIFKTPDVPPGLEVDRRVDINVLYNYKTTGSITLRAVGEQYLKTNYVAKGQTVPGPLVYNTNSPVKLLWPDTGSWQSYYIRVDDSSDAELEQEKAVQIRLINIGSGFPITDNVPGRVYGNITIRGPAKFRDCLGFQNTNTVKITPGTLGADLAKLKIVKGEVTISCIVSINKDLFMQRGIPDEPIILDFDLDYRYYLTKSAEIRINSYK